MQPKVHQQQQQPWPVPLSFCVYSMHPRSHYTCQKYENGIAREPFQWLCDKSLSSVFLHKELIYRPFPSRNTISHVSSNFFKAFIVPLLRIVCVLLLVNSTMHPPRIELNPNSPSRFFHTTTLLFLGNLLHTNLFASLAYWLSQILPRNGQFHLWYMLSIVTLLVSDSPMSSRVQKSPRRHKKHFCTSWNKSHVR